MSVHQKKTGGAEDKLQIVEQFEFVQSRIEELIRHARGLVSLLKKRVQLQKEHMKAMQKLAQSVHDDQQLRQVKFDGELATQWSSLCNGLLTEALFLSNVSSTLESQALQPLTVHLLNDLDKRFKAAIADGRKAIREFQNAKTVAQKAKEKYFSATSDWEGSLMALFADGGDSWAPAAGNKLYEREQLTAKKSQELKAEYESAMEKVNLVQTELHSDLMPEVLLTLNTLALNMVSVVHNALKTFESIQKQLMGPDYVRTQSPLDSEEELNVSEYTHRILFGGRTAESFAPPSPLQCQEYNFKDEALMLTTRKVQYRCMSQLSPAELITRGQQFVNQMDPKNQNRDLSSHSNSTAVNMGINRYLITVCVEYLQQPLALKEEGLFRVPGDNSLMRSLHKDFQTNSVSKENLRASVMEQKDPNTVSGLLKLHLRETGLLSQQSLDQLLPYVESRDHEMLVETVLEMLPAEELQPLLEIVSLLATIVMDPWAHDNKMNPRTLGIACGLSIFPNLDPGKATSLLEVLIKKNQVLQESQTIL